MEKALLNIIEKERALEAAKSQATIDNLLRQVEDLSRKSIEPNTQSLQEIDSLKTELSDLKTKCESLEIQCQTLKAKLQATSEDLQAAMELIQEGEESEKRKSDLINGLHATIDELSMSLVHRVKSTNHQYVPFQKPTKIDSPTKISLTSLKLGDKDLVWDFSKIQPYPIEYEFIFLRDGVVLKSNQVQRVSFLSNVTTWLKAPGLDIQKGKLLKQLVNGQISGSSSGEQGLKHIVENIWEVKIVAYGHWRIFLKKVASNKWVVFHFDDAENLADATLLRLSADL